MARALPLLAAAALAAVPAAPLAAFQPPPPGSLEARVQALEARMAAIEARVPPAAPAPAPVAATCRRLNVNGSRIPPGGTLSVAVNGTIVARYDEAGYGDLEPFMRKGANVIALAFAAAPADNTADAELRCLPPGVASSRTVVLRLRPAPGQLRAETVVVLPGP